MLYFVDFLGWKDCSFKETEYTISLLVTRLIKTMMLILKALLWFLRFFTIVPWGISPSTKLVDCAGNSYMSFSFFFLPFFFILEFRNLFLPAPPGSFLCSFLLSILFVPLMFSTLLSVPCSVLFFSVYSVYL